MSRLRTLSPASFFFVAGRVLLQISMRCGQLKLGRAVACLAVVWSFYLRLASSPCPSATPRILRPPMAPARTLVGASTTTAVAPLKQLAVKAAPVAPTLREGD